MLSDTTSTATIKIADFGLARFFADGSQLRTICGSPLYVAPEILDIGACAETYTPAVDMWSVGVLLYILLSGNSPFDNEDERALFQTIKSGEYSMDDILWEHIRKPDWRLKALDSQYRHENDSFSSVEASVVVTCWESERKRRSPTIGAVKTVQTCGPPRKLPELSGGAGICISECCEC